MGSEELGGGQGGGNSGGEEKKKKKKKRLSRLRYVCSRVQGTGVGIWRGEEVSGWLSLAWRSSE